MQPTLLRRRPLLLIALVLIAVSLVRPAREWIQHRSVVAAFGANATANRISLVKSSNLLCISDLKWSEVIADSRRLNVSVEQAWAVYQPDQLLLKRFHSPRLRLDGIRLRLLGQEELRTDIRAASPVAEQWRELIAEQLRQVQPEKLVGQSKSVRESAKLLTAWTTQFTAWMDQSAQALVESHRVKSRLDAYGDNPLRHEREIIGGLAELQTLSQRLDRVESEIKNSEKTLDAQRRNLVALLQGDLKEFESVYALRPKSIALTVGQQIAAEWFAAVWREQATSAETIEALIAGWMCKPHPPQRGRNVRLAEPDAAFALMVDAAARGEILTGDQTMPFTASGNYRCTEGECSHKATWRFAVEQPNYDSVIAVKVEPDGSTNQCRLAIACYSDALKCPTLDEGNRRPETPPICCIDCNCGGTTLNGTGSLDIAQWLTLSSSAPSNALIGVADIPAEVANSKEPQIVRFQVKGTWSSPVVTPLDEPPQWVSEKLDARFNAELIAAKDMADKSLAERFKTAIDDLNRSVAENRAASLNRSKQFRQQFLTLRNAIHRDLELRSDSSFAQRIKTRAVTR